MNVLSILFFTLVVVLASVVMATVMVGCCIVAACVIAWCNGHRQTGIHRAEKRQPRNNSRRTPVEPSFRIWQEA